MAKKSKKKNNKNFLFVGICAAVATAVVIIAAILIANYNNTLDDSFFVSDNSKYVLALEPNDISFEDTEYNPIKAYYVYFYSGDKITGLKAYLEYTDNTAAKAAANYFKENYSDDSTNNIAINNKYVIFSAPEEEYQSLTTASVKEQIELLESIKNADTEEENENSGSSEEAAKEDLIIYED